MDIILFYNFNSLTCLTGIVEVVSTCSRQPKLITCLKNDNINYNVPFLHVFNWKSNKHKHYIINETCEDQKCGTFGLRERWRMNKQINYAF